MSLRCCILIMKLDNDVDRDNGPLTNILIEFIIFDYFLLLFVFGIFL